MKRKTRTEDRTLSREEIVRLVDEGAWSRRGMSGRGLVEMFRVGSLQDPDEVMDLLRLAHLLPPEDPMHAPLAA
jgi:hypothetical protein